MYGNICISQKGHNAMKICAKCLTVFHLIIFNLKRFITVPSDVCVIQHTAGSLLTGQSTAKRVCLMLTSSVAFVD